MKKRIKKYLNLALFYQKDFFKRFFEEDLENNKAQTLIKKFRGSFVILILLVLLSIGGELWTKLFKKTAQSSSLDSLIPKDFVLIPIEIINGEDIFQLINSHGVVDLYSYSENKNLPEKQAASSIKVLPPEREEGRWIALIPEKEALYLFEYSNPFYAVIQNPQKTNSKIYKKKKKKSLIVIEENF